MSSTLVTDGQPLLQVEGLSVVFDDAAAPAVDGVSWALRPGRVTALVGESGSGKTVSAMAVLGLLPEAAVVGGSIRLAAGADAGAGGAAGAELVGASAETFREVRGAVLSLVSQEPMSAWNPVLTVGDQIAEALRAHRRGPDRPSRRTAYDRVLELLLEAARITTTSSARSATTPMSCVMSSTAVPRSSRSPRSRSRIPAWTVTSSAVVGSSAMIATGSCDSPIATSARWS